MATPKMGITTAITIIIVSSLELGCSGSRIVPLLAAVFCAVVLVISAVVVVVGGSVVGLHRGSSSTGGQFTERV